MYGHKSRTRHTSNVCANPLLSFFMFCVNIVAQTRYYIYTKHKERQYHICGLRKPVTIFIMCISCCTRPLFFVFARAAARLASTCRGFRAAYAESWWPTFDPETDNVLEPRSGRFWRELSPGDDVQAAVGACPKGGCILLRPGTHTLASQEAGITIRNPINIFGRGLAKIQSPGSDHIVHIAPPPNLSSLIILDGLVVHSSGNPDGSVGVYVRGGSTRLQSCVIDGPSRHGLEITNGSRCPPVVINCRCGEVVNKCKHDIMLTRIIV